MEELDFQACFICFIFSQCTGQKYGQYKILAYQNIQPLSIHVSHMSHPILSFISSPCNFSLKSCFLKLNHTPNLFTEFAFYLFTKKSEISLGATLSDRLIQKLSIVSTFNSKFSGTQSLLFSLQLLILQCCSLA